MSTLENIGEKLLVNSITQSLTVDERLIGGFGNDSAFLDIRVNEDELLMLNTDRSGMNVAYKLGLADAGCVGDFGVSHAVSDILVSGGQPLAVSIALLLPSSLDVEFVRQVMLGAEAAAGRYGAFIASGDTKCSSKFAMVVSVIGKCRRSSMLTRAGAKAGERIVAIGDFGLMLSGFIAFKKNLQLSSLEKQIFSDALVFQNPPYRLSGAIAERRLATGSMDNSDGLASTLHSLCRHSGVGVVLERNRVPIPEPVLNVARQIRVDPFQLCLGSGDWQHIYAVPEENIAGVLELAEQYSVQAAVIGTFTGDDAVCIKTDDGLYKFQCLENDRFGLNGTNWFDSFSGNVNYLGECLSD